MTQRGLAQGMTIEPDGSELTAAAAAGATTIYVEDPTDFDANSELEINDQRITYTAVDGDTGAVTLATGLSVAAGEGDRVYVVAGGQTLSHSVLWVSLDDEAPPVPVTIDFRDRALWPEAEEYDDPVPVALSDDLERIVDVPGRTPEYTGAVVRTGEAPDARVELAQNPSFPYGAAGGINMYTGDDETWDPAMLYNQELSGAGLPGWYYTILVASHLKTEVPDAPQIRLLVGPTGSQSISLRSTSINFLGPNNGAAEAAVDVTGSLSTTGELHGDTVWVDSLPTTANAANVNMSVNGQLRQSTSSKRYKDDIQDADLDLDAYLALRQVSWVSKNPDDGTGRFVGRIAEEVADAGLEPLLVRDDAGRPNAVAYPVEVVYLQALAQRQQAQIDDLTARLDALEAKES